MAALGMVTEKDIEFEFIKDDMFDFTIECIAKYDGMIFKSLARYYDQNQTNEVKEDLKQLIILHVKKYFSDKEEAEKMLSKQKIV